MHDDLTQHQEIYALLEDKIPDYGEYAAIPAPPPWEQSEIGLEAIPEQSLFRQSPPPGVDGLVPGARLLVRSPVIDLLYTAAQEIKTGDPQLSLQVLSGHHSPATAGSASLEARPELTSAHHTGGAVDVSLLRNGSLMDMGTYPWSPSKDTYTFSPFISAEAWGNRLWLRQAMLTAGFAPSDAAWWHFSFGDQAWARYYGRPAAVFGPEISPEPR